MPDAKHSSRDVSGSEPGSLVTFPRARSSERPNNLPLELTSFIGREREIAEVERLLVTDTRLLTLTGPGGCGKTRLALAVAADVVEGFEDGVWWVELASLADPALVPEAVASALKVREAPGDSLTEMLVEHLRTKKTLLVVDNCEHLIDACARLVNVMMTSCPYLRVLATSREALGVAGEINWRVLPLSLPEAGLLLPPVEDLTRYEAPRLFVERARFRSASFELTPANAGAIVEICRRLDGIPLAIELAAARVTALTAEQIAERLEAPLNLLSAGGRTTVPRHQTLRATLEWSYGLLSEPERKLFGRLSVFAGGFTLEAAEAVCAGEGLGREDVLDLLSRLVEKSLVSVTERGDEARYQLLETVRQYGWEKLQEAGEEPEIRRRHANFFLELAEEAEPQLKGRQQVTWLERLEREHDNLRAAIRWLLEKGETETVGRLAWALWFFWYLRGHQSEGYRYTREALEKDGALSTSMRAKALCVRAIMSYGLESIEWSKQLWEESAALFRRAGDKAGLAIALGGVGVGALQQGNMERATAALEEGLKLYREMEDKWGISETLGYLGMIPLSRGDYAQATRHFEEALALSREIGNRHSGYLSLHNLALMARGQGDYEWAVRLYAERLRLAAEVGDKADIAYCLEGLAELAGVRGEPERAARLFGASGSLLEAVGTPLYAYAQDRASIERAVEELRARLGGEAFTAAWAQGRAMTLEQAIDYALEETSVLPAAPNSLPAAGSAEARARPELLRIFALGPARVEREGRTLSPSDWTYVKPRELLFYLLSHPSCSREQIGVALWPEASPAQLRGTFHTTLHQLRRALGGPEWIFFEKGRYAFNRSLGYWFDVEAFEKELAEAQRLKAEAPGQAINHLEEAVELYGGDFLEDFADTEWVVIRREELGRRYQEVLLDLAGLLFEEGRHAEAAEAYQKAVAHDELLEAAHRGLMRCQVALGERGRALQHYRGLMELLDERLGAMPAPETVALYGRLRRGEQV